MHMFADFIDNRIVEVVLAKFAASNLDPPHRKGKNLLDTATQKSGSRPLSP